MENIVYISKYASIPPAKAGLRGYSLLENFQMRGHRVLLVSSDSNHLNEESGSRDLKIPSRIIRSRPYMKGESLTRLWSWFLFDARVASLTLGDFRPTIVIFSSPSLLTLVSGLILARRHRSIAIAEVRDIWPLTGIEEYGYSRRSFLVGAARLVEKIGYRLCDGIVGTMPNLMPHIASSVRKPPPVRAIPLGIDASQTTVRPRSKVPGPSFVVGYAGSIGKSNEVETLLKAALILEPRQDITFKIAGSGDLREILERKYKNLTNVNFVGPLQRERVQEFLQSCDILHFGSKNTTLLSVGQSLNKVIEYMLAGRPILASYSGHRTMINEANCGEFLESENSEQLADAILRWSKLPQEVLDEAGVRGYSWVTAERTYGRLSEDYLDFFEEIKKTRGPGELLAPPKTVRG